MNALPRIGSEEATIRLMSLSGLNRLSLNRAWKAAKKFASAERRKNDWSFVWDKFCALTGLSIQKREMVEPHRWPDGSPVFESISKA